MPEQNSIIIYPNTVAGRFIRRLNRFTAEVLIDGRIETVHVKNTGRLKELLFPDAEVTLQRSGNPSRKTAYDLISVYKPGLEWVNIDSLAPNALMKLQLGAMGYDVVHPEYTYGKSRFDFYMERGDKKYLTEVKGCTLAADSSCLAGNPLFQVFFAEEKKIFQAEEKKAILCREAQPAERESLSTPHLPDLDLEAKVGLFPDAPTDRGVKHLNELAAAVQEGFRCSISFVIQMNQIRRVFPNYETHPAFGEALEKAVSAGVGINYYQCHVEADRIEIINSIITLKPKILR